MFYFRAHGCWMYKNDLRRTILKPSVMMNQAAPLELETQRTVIRPFDLADVSLAYGWFSDPDVMRYIPSGPDSTVQDCIQRIERYRLHHQQHGFGKWVITHRENGELLGDCGLTYLPDGRRIELGYRLARKYWGQGLAFEVGKAWLCSAQKFVNASTLYAYAHPDHAASLHVMKKLGFSYLRQEIVYDWEVPMHHIHLADSDISQAL